MTPLVRTLRGQPSRDTFEAWRSSITICFDREVWFKNQVLENTFDTLRTNLTEEAFENIFKKGNHHALLHFLTLR